MAEYPTAAETISFSGLPFEIHGFWIPYPVRKVFKQSPINLNPLRMQCERDFLLLRRSTTYHAGSAEDAPSFQKQQVSLPKHSGSSQACQIPLVFNVFAWTSVLANASILTISAFTVERYLASKFVHYLKHSSYFAAILNHLVRLLSW